MISKLQTSVGKLARFGCLLLSAAALSSACDAPEQDKFREQGGISPDPTGIIAGSILYVGPRPLCDYAGGVAKRVRGRVILTLLHFDNPPPPEGRATSALNLKVINGDELFTIDDCTPEGESPDLSERLTRTVEYSWPQIALGVSGAPVSYQVRGFYDSDEDMNPFFSVKNLPTQGDIAGAALVNPQDPTQGFLEVIMPPTARAKNGFLRGGVVVSLGNYVWMERPAFQASASNRYLNAELPVQVRLNSTGLAADPAGTVKATWQKTCESGDENDECGFRLEQLNPDEVGPTLAAANVQLDFDAERYAFVSEPVDILTVRKNDIDLARADGIADPHPLLGSNAGVPWFTPILIMTRSGPTVAMDTIEKATGVPGVRLIASPLLNSTSTSALRRTHLGSIEMAVPNVAAVELTPDPVCRVPYIAPKNLTRAYETRLSYCSDLPTGVFGMSAIQGVAGGAKKAVEEPEQSDTGFGFSGGRLSGQAWTIPNDLANEEQVGRGKQLAAQGTAQLFVVHDPAPDDSLDCDTAPDPLLGGMQREIVKRGLCAEGQELREENPFELTGIDGQGCLPQFCCDAVKHLCGRPLCDVCTEQSCPGLNLAEHNIRQGPTRIEGTAENGKQIPNCVPFAVPDFCCL